MSCPIIQNFQLECTAHMKIFLISSYQWMVGYSSCFAEFFPQTYSLLITPCWVPHLNYWTSTMIFTLKSTTDMLLEATTLPYHLTFSESNNNNMVDMPMCEVWHTTYFRALKWCMVKRLQKRYCLCWTEQYDGLAKILFSPETDRIINKELQPGTWNLIRGQIISQIHIMYTCKLLFELFIRIMATMGKFKVTSNKFNTYSMCT